ncbi:MAG: hypothetical protein JWO83_3584 [Caulobacteraceae bacterium]|nr:hypothetical protein [Caulobacteraceae bacterium]
MALVGVRHGLVMTHPPMVTTTIGGMAPVGRGGGGACVAMTMMASGRRGRAGRMMTSPVVFVRGRRGRARGGGMVAMMVGSLGLRRGSDENKSDPGDRDGQYVTGERVPEGGDHACFPTSRL